MFFAKTYEVRMRKLFALVFAFVFVLLFQHCKAQKTMPVRLGIGIDAGSTLKGYNFFVGGIDTRLQFPLGNGFSGIVTAGYYYFFNTLKSNNGSLGFVPLKAGLKYFPFKNVYVAGEAGMGFATQNGEQNSFVYSPSVGLAFRNGFDVSIKYEDFTKYNGYASPLALRLDYGFKL